MVGVKSPGPKGDLVDYEFPEEAVTGKAEPWYVKAHNVGDEGNVGAAIGNSATSPGAVILYCEQTGKEYTIEPGFVLHLYASMPKCHYVRPDGTVKFAVAGDYKVLIGAAHKNTEWHIDDFVWVG